MPERAKRGCRKTGCNALTTEGYCDAHKAQSNARVADRWRGSSTERLYGWKWRTFRVYYLREHPLCVDCLQFDKRVIPATDIHHILKLKEHPELQYVESNLKSLCKRHHAIYTARGE